MNANYLQTPITYLKGVGPNRAESLQSELGIHTYQDLLNLFPNRYLDKTQYYKVAQLQRNSSEVQIIGKIINIKTVEQKKGNVWSPPSWTIPGKWNSYGSVDKNGFEKISS